MLKLMKKLMERQKMRGLLVSVALLFYQAATVQADDL